MSLKRDHRGNMILRFRAGGRGSKHEYHNFGPITHDEATFADLAKTWMEIAGLKREESAKEGNEAMLRLHILPVLGAVRVEKRLPVDAAPSPA